MKLKKCFLIGLSAVLILVLTACGKSDITDGIYCKSPKTEFPYIVVENEEFKIYQDTDNVYSFSAYADSDGEYEVNINEFVKITISKKNKDKIKVKVEKRTKNIASSIDILIYKNLKGTYSRE